eukprot:jgi/Psemu1/13896/gm1.13896_g
MKRLSFSSLTTNTEEELPSQVNKVCYQVSLSLSIILEKYITPTSIHHLFADDSSGPASFNKQDTHKPKHKRRPMVDTKRNSIKLPRRNSKKKGTDPQPIIDTRTLSERIPLLADSKPVTTKELRALLFVLNIRYRSNMSKFCLRELVSGALSQDKFSDVVHCSESNVKRGKFIITDNPSTVREDIMGSKLKNPSVHISQYCKASNSDFNNCQKGALLCAKDRKLKTELEELDASFCSDCLGQFSSMEEKQSFWEQRQLIDTKHNIEREIAYAELYRMEERSRPSPQTDEVSTNTSEYITDYESPPPSPRPGMDTGPITFTWSSNHFQYIQSNGSPANGEITHRCDFTEALTIECRDKKQATFVIWKTDKNVFLIVHPANPDIQIPIYNCKIDWSRPKPERTKVGGLDFSLMSMVGKVSKNFFKDLEESMNDKWSGPFLPKTIQPCFIKSRLGSKCLVDITTEIYGRTFYNNVDLYEYKQGLAIVDKCVLRLGTSIKGDQRLEITLPKAEKILMSLVIGHALKSNVDIAYHSSAETGLNCYSICYSSGGYSEELYLPQPDERTLMQIYFQCDLTGLSAILSFFNKCHDEYSENQGLDPVLIDRELAHCFGVFLHRQKHANKLNKTRSFSSRFLGLPISQLVIEKVARKSWPMFVDIFKEDRARNYLTLYDRSFATGRKSIHFDFTITPKRRLFIIPINLGGSHWAVNLVFRGSNGQYLAIQLDPMVPKSKFPSEKEVLLLSDFFSTNTNTDQTNPTQSTAECLSASTCAGYHNMAVNSYTNLMKNMMKHRRFYLQLQSEMNSVHLFLLCALSNSEKSMQISSRYSGRSITN